MSSDEWHVSSAYMCALCFHLMYSVTVAVLLNKRVSSSLTDATSLQSQYL